MAATSANPGFEFGLGPSLVGLGLSVPVLAGERIESVFPSAVPAGEAGGFALFECGEWLVGTVVEPVGRGTLEPTTERLYASMLAETRARGVNLARVWNYVPEINEPGADGLENYRVFCRGRAEALECAGVPVPPAASAVGGAPGRLGIMFAACRGRPRVVENPEQIPAYRYPDDYGPRSPSFSRAAQVVVDGRRWTFVSGTAAIKGHLSMARDDLSGQIACTLDNLRLITSACGLNLGGASGFADAERHLKIYLRHAADLPEAGALLERTLLRGGDRVAWLHSDICRADLLIEIEMTIIDRDLRSGIQ